jgi:hypothetical protein
MAKEVEIAFFDKKVLKYLAVPKILPTFAPAIQKWCP